MTNYILTHVLDLHQHHHLIAAIPSDNIAIDAVQKVTEVVTVLNALLSLATPGSVRWAENQHSGVGLLLYLYLSGEPVGGWGYWGQACIVPPHTSLVQELPLTTIDLWGSRTQGTVKEGGELCHGQHAGTVLEGEDQGDGSGAVQGEEEGSPRVLDGSSKECSEVRAHWIQD